MGWEEKLGHECYDIKNMLAIKIHIVLEININSSSSADKKEGADDPKTFSQFCQQK